MARNGSLSVLNQLTIEQCFDKVDNSVLRRSASKKGLTNERSNRNQMKLGMEQICRFCFLISGKDDRVK